ncbi:MAG: hypothetical protein J6I56_05630 [Lachnospiraceae bacterium]|nr:hypothetical protein [Lachnospiraceae bacterium]
MRGAGRLKRFTFLEKHRSTRALFAIFLGALSVVSCLLTFYFTYRNGEATAGYGAVILLCLVFGVSGMILALLSRQEEDALYLLSYIGMALNGITLVLCTVVLYLGI